MHLHNFFKKKSNFVLKHPWESQGQNGADKTDGEPSPLTRRFVATYLTTQVTESLYCRLWCVAELWKAPAMMEMQVVF